MSLYQEYYRFFIRLNFDNILLIVKKYSILLIVDTAVKQKLLMVTQFDSEYRLYSSDATETSIKFLICVDIVNMKYMPFII
jgi:hypothetical protein